MKKYFLKLILNLNQKKFISYQFILILFIFFTIKPMDYVINIIDQEENIENLGNLEIFPKEIICYIISFLHNNHIKGDFELYQDINNLRLINKKFKDFIDQNVLKIRYDLYKISKTKEIIEKYYQELSLIDPNITRIHVAAQRGFFKYLLNNLITNNLDYNDSIIKKDINQKTTLDYLVENCSEENYKDFKKFMNKLTYAELGNIDYQNLLNKNLKKNDVKRILTSKRIQGNIYGHGISIPIIMTCFIINLILIGNEKILIKYSQKPIKDIISALQLPIHNFLFYEIGSKFRNISWNKYIENPSQRYILNNKHKFRTKFIVAPITLVCCLILTFIIEFRFLNQIK